MIIEKGINILLFRFKDYRRYSFIEEHTQVLNEEGHVWILKSGKIPDVRKLERIKDDGGFIILKTPKAEGNNYYLAQFDSMSNNGPDDNAYPSYYKSYLDEENNNGIWIRITRLTKIKKEIINRLVLANGEKPVLDVINKTMTSFMFVKTTDEIEP